MGNKTLKKEKKIEVLVRESYVGIINSRKSKQNKKEGKTQQNNLRTFPRVEGHEIPLRMPVMMDGLIVKSIIIESQNTGNKEKNPTNF